MAPRQLPLTNPWETSMKLSFWTLGTPDWTNEQVVDGAKRFGYQGVDLRCAPGRNISVQSTDAEVRELKHLFGDEEIEIASLLAYNERGNADGVDWPAVTADLLAHCALANKLGTKNLRVNAGAPARDSTMDAYIEGFATALTDTLAQTKNVTLNMQNHPGSLTAVEVGKLAQMVNDPRFGIGLSPDHCADMGEEVATTADAVASLVKHLHVADRERLPGGKLKACLPGTGIIPNMQVMHTLGWHGFDGWVSFKWEKPTYPDLPDAEVALPHFVEFMKKLGE
jgi:sugar phosphate isomerase/epimerase